MKRSQSINLAAMRKQVAHVVRAKPLALAVATATLMACSSSKPATAYQSIDDCVNSQAGTQDECQAAYDNAIAEAQKSGPKYGNVNDCAAEFGAGQCTEYRGSNGQSWFVPAMAGFLLARALDSGNRYNHSAPLYTSHSRGSPFYGQWSAVDGQTYGSVRNRDLKVSKRAFEPKPAVKTTLSRGGFGSKVAAKSNWGGGGKKSGGWGG